MMSRVPEIDPTAYQVFLCASPAMIFISMFAHTWFVVNQRGKVSRWEIFHVAERPPCAEGIACGTYRTWGHLHRDYQAPFEGIGIFVGTERYRWPGRILGNVSGGEGSLAEQMAARIVASPGVYPFTHAYEFTGTNSNTYTQWIIDQFPKCGFVQPWNAAGKGCNYRARLLRLSREGVPIDVAGEIHDGRKDTKEHD